jgi:hypothetical protein
VTYLFKYTNPLALILLIVLAGLPIFNSWSIPPITSEDGYSIVYDWTMGIFKWIHPDKGIGAQMLGSIFIFMEALFLNKIISDHKLMEKPGYLPALSFILLNALIPNTMLPSNIIINALLILIFNLLVISYKQNRSFNILLLIGFLSGFIASLNTSYLLLYLWSTIAILIMRPLSIREWLLLTAGFVLPFYFMLSGLYLFDQLDMGAVFPSFKFDFRIPKMSILQWISLSVFLALPLIGIIKAGDKLGKMVLQVRKSYLITMVLWLNCLLIILVHLNGGQFQSSLLLVPSAIMFAPFFGSFKRDFIPNLLIILLIVTALIR